MSRFVTLALAAVLLCLGGATQGQGHDAHWIFGNGFHLEFNGEGPTVRPPIPDYNGGEGTSCIADKLGNLLYYSNVTNVWNGNFLPLLNSDTLSASGSPTASSKTNGSLFLPWPGDSADRYFVFFSMNVVDDKLYLSRIDALLDMGLGGIEDSLRYRPVWDIPVAEHLNAVRHANGRDWWIIGRTSAISDEIVMALLTPNGIEYSGTREAGYMGHPWGSIVFSRNGQMMAFTNIKGVCVSSPSTLALYHFDRCEGELLLLDILVTRTCAESAYGVAFSPNGEKLYYSIAEKPMVYQVSLIGDQLVDTLIFALSGPHLSNNLGGNLVLGKDDKIYVNYSRPFSSSESDTLAQYLGIITNPNTFGLDC